MKRPLSEIKKVVKQDSGGINIILKLVQLVSILWLKFME